MWNLINYSFLTKIRNRSIVFWPLIFPFILTTVMYFSIGQMEESDFETVNVAVVAENADGNKAEEAFLTWLEMMEESSDMIHIEQMEEDEALDRLEKGQIDGIFYNGETPALTVGRNGLPESILQIVLENYIEGRKTLEDVAAVSPEKLKDAVSAMEDYTDSIEQVTLGGKTTNGNVQFFYALLGMASLYGCFIGYGSAMELQAYLTPLAARRCAGPSNRLHVILSETLVSFVLHFVNMMILLAYMKYVLRLEFSGSYAEMLPALFLGSMIGVTMGMFITSIGKMGEGMKVGVMVGVSMAMSFCAGLMNADIKNIIDRSAPLLNRINPAALISDALYCINVYDAPARYAQDILILGVMCVLLTAGTYLIIRRERYGSI